MAGEIEAAIKALNKRKVAITESTDPVSTIDGQDALHLVGGFDLPPGEVQAAGQLAAKTGLDAAIQGHDIGALMSALYLDGLAMGLLIAEARAKAEAS